MIDLATEQLVALADVPPLLPRRRGGRRVHLATLHRWCTKGLKGRVLESLQVGGTRCTSREALQRFFGALDDEPAPRARSSTPAQRARDDAEDEAALDRLGV